MAVPTTLGAPGFGAAATFPVGGSAAPLVQGLHLFLDGAAIRENLLAGTLRFTDRLEQRDTCEWTHHDPAGAAHLKPGQPVVLRENGANIFKGTIERTEEVRLPGSSALQTRVEAIDLKGIAERRLVTADFSRTATAAGTVMTDLVSTFMASEGVTTNSVQAGPTINASFKAFERTVWQAFDEIAVATGFQWFIDALGDLHFEPRTQTAAPFSLTDAAPNCLAGLTVSRSRERYRNKVTVRYTSNLSLNVTRDDTAAQSAQAALEGGTGIYHLVDDQPAITTAADANARGDALNRRFAAIPLEVRYATRTGGLRAGHLQTITLSAHGLDGSFLVDSVVLRDRGKADLLYEVVALSGEHLGGDVAFWQALAA